MRLVYVCSPLRGDIEKNIQRAHEYCAYAADCGTIPLAPHTIFTHYLDDQRPEQRERGLNMGLELLKRCDEIWVMGSVFSAGMLGEIAFAKAEDIPTLYVPDSFVQCGNKIRQEDAVFTEADCIPGSNRADYESQILVLKPEAYGAGAEITADDSLWLADMGNGCRYGARGQMVMAESLLSGRRVHWERHDFYGIVEPDRLLDWMADKPVRNDRVREILDLAEQELTANPEQDRDGEDLEL